MFMSRKTRTPNTRYRDHEVVEFDDMSWTQQQFAKGRRPHHYRQGHPVFRVEAGSAL